MNTVTSVAKIPKMHFWLPARILPAPVLETLATSGYGPQNLDDFRLRSSKPWWLPAPILKTLTISGYGPRNLDHFRLRSSKPWRLPATVLETLTTSGSDPTNLVDYRFWSLELCEFCLDKIALVPGKSWQTFFFTKRSLKNEECAFSTLVFIETCYSCQSTHTGLYSF